MKNIMQWVLSATFACGISVSTACSSDKDNTPVNPQPGPQIPDTLQIDTLHKDVLQVGAYVWGSTIYDMGPDGATRLAEAYEKAGIKHAILLVKGEKGTIGYLRTSLPDAPMARTDRDILAETVSAMHERDIKVYAWFMVGKDASWLKKHPSQGSYHFRRGYSDEVVDLSQDEYRQYMADIIREIDQNYSVDGFAFDMVRFLGPYYGWADSDYQRLTAPKTEGGYGLTLNQYNELVTLLSKQYGYPCSPDANGRLIYDANAQAPNAVGNALLTAYKPDVPSVFAFGKMRENIIDSISKFLVSQTQKPTYVASMPECTYSPSSATILYGMTYNQAYTYDVASPMLYSAAYSEGATWVTRNIEYLKKLGYQKIMPSLQAYRSATTESLAADVKATLDADCPGYLIFRTGTCDMARPVIKNDSCLELTYVRGTDNKCGNLTVTIIDATPSAISMGGKFSGTNYTLNGQTVTFSAESLGRLGDYGTVSIRFPSGKLPAAVNVASDVRIVYNAPIE